MMTTNARARAGAEAEAGAVIILVLFLLHVADIQALRTGYRLPQSMGRSAAATAPAAAAENGSGRDLLKKFMLWRNLFPPEPPRDNVIVVPQPTYVTTLTPTATPTTTTTTTTVVNGTNTRRWRNLEDEGAQKRLTQRTTHRIRPNTKTRSYGQRRRTQPKKKKTRRRHIHKRRQQRRRYK